MPKLNIDGTKISYDTIDVDNKIVIAKVPSSSFDNIHNGFKKFSKFLQEKCNAKNCFLFANDIDYDSMELPDAIRLIDDYINELYHIREELLE